ncbi:hypothetical protein ACHAXT_005853 [Thalassiosira profunda]
MVAIRKSDRARSPFRPPKYLLLLAFFALLAFALVSSSEQSVAHVRRRETADADALANGNEVSDSVGLEQQSNHEMSLLDNIETTAVSVRDQLLARSLEARDFIRETLQGYVAPLPAPQYEHYEFSRDQQMDNSTCFSGEPIDGWHPPEDFPEASVQEWEEAYQDTTQRIEQSTAGGHDLRAFAKSEYDRLRALRYTLFCDE